VRALDSARATEASPGLTLPAVWHDDLVEWEGHGSAAEACADVLLDTSEPKDSVVRRAALVGRLAALAAEAAPREERAEALALLAEHLAPVELYSLIAPLERLAADPAPTVRAAALRALGRYYYKRTFVAVERALRDPEPEVVEEATRTLERLRFDHAFEPLYRIYRVAERVDARHAALRAMARIDHEEAARLALSTLEHGAPAERAVVVDALRHCPATSFQKLAKSALPSASPPLRRTLQDMFRARGWKA
jgi:HEAT repeat protein